MSCSCAYEVEGDCDEIATVWEESRIQATKKEHRCYECCDVIPQGSRCCKAVGLYDGRWLTMYRCLSCATYCEYVSLAAELCPLWGHLHDFVEDNDLGYGDEDDLGNEIWIGLPTLRQWRRKEREQEASA
jgi:hypothetical protein